MIEVAQRWASAPTDVHYVGLDLFEGQSEGGRPGSSLKEVHQLLRASGARVQLVPGNPPEELIRLANSLGKVDVLIVPAELDSTVVCPPVVFCAPDASRAVAGIRRAEFEPSRGGVDDQAAAGDRPFSGCRRRSSCCVEAVSKPVMCCTAALGCAERRASPKRRAAVPRQDVPCKTAYDPVVTPSSEGRC